MNALILSELPLESPMGMECALGEWRDELLRRGWGVGVSPYIAAKDLDRYSALIIAGVQNPDGWADGAIGMACRGVKVIQWMANAACPTYDVADIYFPSTNTQTHHHAFTRFPDARSEDHVIAPIDYLSPADREPLPKLYDLLFDARDGKGGYLGIALAARNPKWRCCCTCPADPSRVPRLPNLTIAVGQPRDQFLRLIRRSRVLLHATTMESFGRVVWEAGMVGTPIVATAFHPDGCFGLRETVGDEGAQWIRLADPVEAWEAAVKRAFTGETIEAARRYAEARLETAVTRRGKLFDALERHARQWESAHVD